jgi:hypothetical protein
MMVTEGEEWVGRGADYRMFLVVFVFFINRVMGSGQANFGVSFDREARNHRAVAGILAFGLPR